MIEDLSKIYKKRVINFMFDMSNLKVNFYV